MPTSPTTLPAESNTEWMPSACIEADPLSVPQAYFAAATPRFSSKMIHSTRRMERMRSETGFLAANARAMETPFRSRPTRAPRIRQTRTVRQSRKAHLENAHRKEGRFANDKKAGHGRLSFSWCRRRDLNPHTR